MTPSFAARLTRAILIAIIFLSSPLVAAAHAVPTRANPPIDGVVNTAPQRVEIWFSEEVSSDGTRVEVIGPDGSRVDRGDAAVDLNDLNRQLVTVSLDNGTGSGTYIVQWHSVSSLDQDAVDGSFRFTVDPNATPQPIASVAAETTSLPAMSPTPTPVPVEEYDFDERAVGLSVAAGLVIAALIFVFWRSIRPRPPQ